MGKKFIYSDEQKFIHSDEPFNSAYNRTLLLLLYWGFYHRIRNAWRHNNDCKVWDDRMRVLLIEWGYFASDAVWIGFALTTEQNAFDSALDCLWQLWRESEHEKRRPDWDAEDVWIRNNCFKRGEGVQFTSPMTFNESH